MKLIPHHQDDKHGTREYRSPAGAWRVVQTRRPGGSRNARPRREVHHGRSVGGRERHDSARQAARDPRTLAGTTPVQPAPAAEGADHARPRRNPLPGHPVVVVRRPAGSPSGSGRRPATGRQAAMKAAKKET